MKLHSKHFIKHLAQGFAFLFLIIFFLHIFHIIPGYWGDKTIYFLFSALIIGSIFIGWEIYELSEKERENSPFIIGISYGFLGLLVLIVLDQFFTLSIIHNFKLELVSLSAALGVLTLYANQKTSWNKLEKDKADEKEMEDYRYSRFPNLYPALNKIPIIRIFFRWMYKEGWVYSLSLLAIILLAFVLRVWKVGYLGMTVDEHFAYSVAQNIIEHGKFLNFYNDFYYRGWTYTLLVALSFLLFGISEFALRLPGVIIGSLTIIPIYFFSKKLSNKNIAIFASLFLALFTWPIYYSRWGRHYILASFLLIISLYYTYSFLESNLDKHKYLSIFSTALLVLTLKELLLIPLFYIGIIIYIKKFKIKWGDLLVFIGYIIPIGLTLLIPESIAFGSTTNNEIILQEPLLFKALNWTVNWLAYQEYKYFFVKLLYLNYPLLILSIIIFFFIIILNKNRNLSILLSPLIVFILMNIIGRHKPWNVRQISFILPFFALLIFIVGSILYSKKSRQYFVLLLLCISIINPVSLVYLYHLDYGSQINGTIFELTSAEQNYADYKTPTEYILSNKLEKDAVITDQSISIGYFSGKLDFYSLKDLDEERDMLLIDEILKNNNRTWILNTLINDDRQHFKKRNGKVRKFLDANEDKVVYIGEDKISKVYLFENKTIIK